MTTTTTTTETTTTTTTNEVKTNEEFVRERPGAANGLEEAIARAMREVSMGACARAANATTLTTTDANGVVTIDSEAVWRFMTVANESAREAAMRVAKVAREESREESGTTRGAFQRAVFESKLLDAVARRTREEVQRLAEVDLRMARRRTQENGIAAMQQRTAAGREAPHKPWFLLETAKEESARESREAKMREAALEAGEEAASTRLAERAPEEPAPDPSDETILGVVKHCFYMVHFHPRPIQKVLDYLFGYSPAIDGEDLEELLAYSKGIPVPRGKTPRDLAYVYAADLDKSIGTRDRVALTTLIRDVRDEWSTHIRAGVDATKQLEESPLDSAEDIRVQNRESWLRALFPNNDWPTRSEKTYKFMESLREEGAVEASCAVPTSRPVPLAVSRANLKASTAAAAATSTHGDVSISIGAQGKSTHYSKAGIPIVAPDGFFPKTKAALRAEGVAARAAAARAEQRLEFRRRGGTA